MRVLIHALLPVLLLSACATSGGSGGSSSSSGLDYGESAQADYERALLAFRRDNCIEAEPAFRAVRRKYPYSRFAALAELRVADCKMKQDEWAEAITAYRQFVRFRPSHSQIPYARFRIAEAHFEQIPSEWLLSPPSHERDTQSTQEALRQLRRFILDFPENQRVAEAQGLIKKALKILAAHELYVARFYLRRDAYPAVVNRLRTMLTSYDGSGLEAEALLLLGETYLEMRDREQARRAFQELVDRYPEADEADDARDQLGSLGG
ncbi:MAG: outer membrane protein assembly factor BamD [Deltaproteobacteria bacterium]|nr:outer membrane protein assembly factor BamD [Deltaproteobacteria bacterium]